MTWLMSIAKFMTCWWQQWIALTEDNGVEIDANNNPEKKRIVPNFLTGSALTPFHLQWMPRLAFLKKSFKAIQQEHLILAEAKCLFNMARKLHVLSGKFDCFDKHLQLMHELSKCSHFEFAVNKLFCAVKSWMRERNSCACLLTANWDCLFPQKNDAEESPALKPSMKDSSLGKFLSKIKQTKNQTAMKRSWHNDKASTCKRSH